MRGFNLWFDMFATSRYKIFNCLFLYWSYGFVFGRGHKVFKYRVKRWTYNNGCSRTLFSRFVCFGWLCI